MFGQDKEIATSAMISSVFEDVDKNTNVEVSKYIIYGTHLNIEGNVEIPEISGINIDKSEIILKDINNNETTINSEYTYSDGNLSFSTIDKLNSGLYLEDLSKNNYFIFLKVTFSNSEIRYYSLSNKTDYDDTTYYTITKNKSNNKIDIKFDNYNNIPYMNLDVSEISELPDDVYDVVIDPGHGGTDSGATSEGYHESEIVLDCGLKLKSQLEDLGLKVLITRDGSESSDEDTAYSMYDNDGRVTIANESGAKILISLHLNSNSADLSDGGVEVYAPTNCDLTFASLLADNIVQYADTSYSSLDTYKKADVVYVRGFSDYDISAFEDRAIRDGYEPYDLTNDTPYLYIIREIGGICTNAFVDGRNTSYEANKYIDSNVGIEGYLIELGYMIVDDDLHNILNNEDSYMQAICNSIKSFYNL